MNIEIIIVISVLAVGFLLFLFELFTIDVTALIILSCFFGLGYLTPSEAVSGFSNPAVITIGLLFILSSAIQKTGLLEYLVITINRLLKTSRSVGMAVYYITISIASSLINNTAIVAIFMPVTIRLAHRYHLSPSKMLIPLSYAAILGGTLTLVGTSTNLLVNSINYGSQNGSTEISISVLTEKKVIVRMTDNGEGISKEHIPRLFERFYRVDVSRSRSHGGSGLGLAIVKHIIDAHNENIFVNSEPGVGSEFSFTLQKSV